MGRLLMLLTGPGLLAAISAGLTGCSQGPAQTQPPPPKVTVSYAIQRQITDYAEYPGRVAAVNAVQVRARVSGYLQKVNFKDGDEVQQGQILYVIDPRLYKAALDQAQAQVSLQEAQLTFNEAVYNRNAKLLASGGAVSLEDVQQSRAQRDTTRAALEAAKASVAQAKLNLEWTNVTAPIGGRLSRTLLTIGNLVIADQTLLTTLIAQDPMYAYFDVDEATVLRVQQLIREGKFHSFREQGVRVPVSLGTEIEEGYPHEGHLDFVNNQINPSTSTLQVRGVFANPQPPVGSRLLHPGLFVRVRVPVSAPYQALLVVQRAIGTDQNLNYVYVVDNQGQVERRDVQLGTQQGPLQVIARGLNPGERVVVDGLQKVRPGQTVNFEVIPMGAGVPAGQPHGPTSKTGPGLNPRPQPAPVMQQNMPPRGKTR